MNSDRVKVKIFKDGYIPGIGSGPIRIPTYISREKYERLLKLGFNVILVEEPKVKIPEKLINNTSNTKNETKEVTPVVEEPKVVEEKTVEIVTPVEVTTTEEVTETPTETEEEAPNEEVSTEEKVVNDRAYAESTLTSRNICKKILNNRKIQFDDDASLSILKKLVLDTNPPKDN
jgi:hypothetical protein